MHLKSIVWVAVGSLVFTAGCRKVESPASPTAEVKDEATLVGKWVSIAFNRSALGLSTVTPVSRQTGNYNGVELTLHGRVVSQTSQFLAISSNPDGHERDEQLQWIPITSILSVREKRGSGMTDAETLSRPESWRLEALHNLLGMEAFPLKDLPQGDLRVWLVQDGKSEFLDEFPVSPGFDQWLCIGVDPVNNDALFMSVLSEESKGHSLISLPVPKLTPFHSLVKKDHDWTKPSPIAAEGSGDARIHAVLTKKAAGQAADSKR